MQRSMTMIVLGCAASIALCTIPIHARQKLPAAEAAERLSGTWTINRELSPSFRPSGRSGGRSGGAAFAVAGVGFQRGRGGGSNGPNALPTAPADLTPEERAEQSAMRDVEQIAPSITLRVTPDTFSVVDQRGEHTCAVNGRSAKLDVSGAKIDVKCHWNKQTLQQEFSGTRRKLTRSWSVDDSGRLVLKIRSEGVGLRAVEAAAVYDRTPS